MIENSKKNQEIEIEQLKQKNLKEIEVLNLKNNLLINKNKEREIKMKELINKLKVITIEKNELENVIILQEKKVNELNEKINKIDLIINIKKWKNKRKWKMHFASNQYSKWSTKGNKKAENEKFKRK